MFGLVVALLTTGGGPVRAGVSSDVVRGSYIVQLRPGASLTTDEIVTYAKGRLSAAKYPRDVRVVDALPLTSVFKLDRKALRSQVN